jgi:hypothetical protein
MRASRSAFWTWLTIRRNSLSEVPVPCAMVLISVRMRST